MKFVKLLILVLNKVDKLDKLLKEFASQHVTGATIVNSRGLARELMNKDELNIIGSFRQLLDVNRKESKTIFMVVKEEKVEQVVAIIENIVGSLDQPDTGILFTTPIDFIRGYKQ